MDYLNLITSAVIYIEDHLFEDDLLTKVYKVVHVSKFHFLRMFHLVTKHTPGQYIKKRRFTEITRMVCQSDESIINIAVHAGYNSHEAFTRAFKTYFGVTPSAFRKKPEKQTFLLLEAFSKGAVEFSYYHIIEPEIISQDELTLYGLRGEATLDANSIDSLWQAFREQVRQSRTGEGYTVWLESRLTVQDLKRDKYYDCFVGIETHQDLEKLTIPSGPYAKFTISAEFSKVYLLYAYIYFNWFKKSKYEFGNDMILECYSSDFDYSKQTGYLSILVPIKEKNKIKQ